MPGVKGVVSGAVKGIGEAIVKPTVDEGKVALDEGIQSVFGTTSTPPQTNPQNDLKTQQRDQKLKQEDETKKRNILQFFKNLQDQEQRFKQNKIKDEQQKQTVLQEEQKKNEVKQFEMMEQSKKRDNIAVTTKQRRVEQKKGVSG